MTDQKELRATIKNLKKVVDGWTAIPLAADQDGDDALFELDIRMNDWHIKLEAAVKDVAGICGVDYD